MNTISELFATLSSNEKAALAEALEQKGAAFNAFPLSFSQERLWFLNQLEPESPSYNVPSAMRVTGPLNVQCLHDSLNEIVRRHESFRTAFLNIDGQPFQTISAPVRLELLFIDLIGSSANYVEDAGDRLIGEAARRPFDLTSAPLIRAVLMRMAEQQHVLQLTMHHIVSDGWSSSIIAFELASIYEDFLHGKPSGLKELSIQYVDYAVWQRNHIKSDSVRKQLDYWTSQLKGTDTLLELPTDKPRPAAPTHAGIRKPFTFSPELTESLKAIAKREGATLFMVLVAAFKALLHRYTGQESINVGTSIAGRTEEEIEELIGCFLNTLVLHTRLSPQSTFRQLLSQVRETALSAYANQDVPIELILDALQLQRSPGYNPLFQVMLILQNTPEPPLHLAGSRITLAEGVTGTAKFDLTFDLKETQQGIDGKLEYSTDLFEEATINRLVSHFEVCLLGVADNPDMLISNLPLMRPYEIHQITVDWNQTTVRFPAARGLHELFEARAAEVPDVTAVEFGEQQMSYQELNYRANQLAHHLVALGVGPEVRVAICLARSIEMIIALLGTLKAGGAYIPLDPSYPRQRNAFVLQDSHAAVVLAQQSTMESLPAGSIDIVSVDADSHRISRESGENIGGDLSPANLAYLIYTSGSTGAPKGVMTTHGSLTNYTHVAAQEYLLSIGDRVLQFASINFDASAEEIYPCLVSGATLVLRKESMLDSIAGFLQECRKLSLTVLDLPTAYWHEVALELDDETIPESVRTVIIGGEKALVPSFAKWLESIRNHVRLANTYGPTEGTIVSTHFEASGSIRECATWKVVPIGQPIGNVRTYVLDSNMQPVPVGIAGELCVGGAGVARGYSDKPDLTAEKFAPDPFHKDGSCRLYRSGDLVRYRQDGVIEFLGRIDNQVKVRGFRIELGEVEAALSLHPAVRETVVVAQECAPGDNRLVAYVVAHHEAPQQTSDLRDFLKERLPAYMVPSVFMHIDRVPLTPSGKVDRRGLPAPDFNSTQATETFAPARTTLEELMCNIWCEVLGLERIGIHDNFFDLGGHSLLATRLMARVRDVLQIELSLNLLFENPTVAGLAAKAETARQDKEPLPVLPIQRAPRDEHIPLSFAQERIWFLNKLNPANASYHVPRAFRLRGTLNTDLIAQVFTELVRRHEILRTTFPSIEERPVQVIHPPEPFDIKLVDLSLLTANVQEEQVHKLIVDQGRKPFDLAADRLVRLTIVQLRPQENALILTEHHLVHDGWTQGVLLKDFLTLYSAFVAGDPSPLSELPMQYADFAYWQRSWLQGEILQAQLAYWKEKLSGAPRVHDLPLDRPRPPVQTPNGAQDYVTLPAEVADSMRALSRREGVTLYMTMQAAFIALLYRYSGQQDIVLGSGVANRRWRELEGLLGMIINTVVFKTELSGNPTFVELLGRVRETCLGAYAHQDTPFEKIVEVLQPERSTSYNPIFQIMYNFQDAPTSLVELPGMGFEIMESHNLSAKFDMTITVQPRAEQFAGSGITRFDNEILILWEYNTDLFNADTMQRMQEHYKVLLQSIVAAPNRHISELPMLSESERLTLIEDWSGAEPFHQQDGSLQEIFEAQVKLIPDAIAAEFEQQQVSYQELNRRANKLAHYLTKRGVGPEISVGLLLPRSIDSLIALLAIIKAGGIYVPMDPANPRERLSFIIEDSEVSVLILLSSLADLVSDQSVEMILLDMDKEYIKLESGQNPACKTAPDNAAYIIYTSGSNGRPKGVIGLQRGALNRFDWMWRTYPFRQAEICCQKTSIGVVDTIWETLGPVLGGVRLVVLSDQDVKDLDRFVRTLAMTEATRIVLVPAMMRALLDVFEDLGQQLPVLDCWTCSGEQMQADLFTRFSQAMSGTRLLNLYGMTEAAADVTCFDTGDGASADRHFTSDIPIGRPLDNLRVYLLDGEMQPVPIGARGEIFLGGEGLARGYFNRSDLTAERFIPDPFSKRAGDRLYRAGDLARHLSDGNIEYEGRADNQVKVRGFRVEPDEVEFVLRSHQSIREAALSTNEDRNHQVRLTGYVALKQGHKLSATELRSFVSRKLPDYMVPSNFVFLEDMPLTASGKIDRKRLPATEDLLGGETEGHGQPRNQVEEIIAAIWAGIFGVERIDTNKNFFELGGHSLLGTQVMSRIRQAFRVELPLRTLFENLTVPALAETIQKSITGREEADRLPIESVPRDRLLPLSFSQQRLWFTHHMETDTSVYNISYLIRLEGTINIMALEQSINEIIRRHEILRTKFALAGGGTAQFIRPAATCAIPVVELQDLPEASAIDAAGTLASKEARRNFDLNDNPLRLTLLWLGAESHILLLTLHHIVSDAWSGAIFVREFMAFYNAFHGGQPSSLPELPIQYADFAVWQQKWVQTATAQAQLDCWRKALADLPEVFELPTDYPRPENQINRGARLFLQVPEDLHKSLELLSVHEQVTLFMVLFAAFTTLVYTYSGRDDIVIATPIAGRNRIETESLIGLFVNMLLLRSRMSSDMPFSELLRQVREIVLKAYANQDVPFDKLVSELDLIQDQRRIPGTRIGFDLHNEMAPEVELPGVRLSASAVETGTARADLLVVMRTDASGLNGYFEYDTDLFAANTISNMASLFVEILRAIQADPQQSVQSLAGLRREILLANPAANQFKETYALSNLTKYQFLLWVSQKLNPDFAISANTMYYRLGADMDVGKFQQAFQALVNSSDSFRTVIEEAGGTPQQRCVDSLAYKTEVIDFSRSADPEASAMKWISSRAQTPFVLEERLFDSMLLKMPGDEFIYVLSMHHIICDAKSFALSFEAIFDFYELALKGQLELRKDLPQFARYAEHERALRHSPNYQVAEAYWKQKLGQYVEPLTFYGRSVVKRTSRIKRYPYLLSLQKTEELKAIAAQGDPTQGKSADARLANILAAVLITFLNRVTGKQTICLGVPYHNRRPKEFKEIIGLIMQILPVRINIESGDTFNSLITKIASENKRNLDHIDYPVGNPLQRQAYEVEFNYIPSTLPAFRGTKVSGEWLIGGNGDDSLSLQVHDLYRTGQLHLEFDFHRDLFDDEQSNQAITDFLMALDAFINDANCRIDSPGLFFLEAQKHRLRELEEQATFDIGA
jgi:amino acid adenylation domain-containing protein